MSKKRLAIYGAGGLGREISIWASRLSAYDFLGFFDDHVHQDSPIGKYKVLGNMQDVQTYCKEPLCVVIAIGDSATKAKIAQALTQYENVSFPAIVHPKAIVEDVETIDLGDGVIITAGCVLTTSIRLGKHVLVNLNCTIGHDVVIGDYTSVMPGAHLSGKVLIHEKVLIGTGACLLNGIEIGAESRVGAGAVVVDNIPSRCTAVGVPAKKIRQS